MTLHFHMQLSNSTSLLEGALILTTEDGEFNYLATSGCSGYQSIGAWNQKRRGCIPPCEEVGIDHYLVATTPIYMPGVKGVEGNFYCITPFEVKVDTGIIRGDFGIHFDANVPGSAGCIVLRKPTGWETFQKRMRKLAGKGINKLKLKITYS